MWPHSPAARARKSAVLLAFSLALGAVAFLPLVSSARGASNGPWYGTTSFPALTEDESCVASSGYIYCIAAANATQFAAGTSYFASTTPSGVSPWTKTTDYPLYVGEQACAASSGYVYCLDGATYYGTPGNETYFAPLSPSGVGAWTDTSESSVSAVGESCATYSGYMYCVGGTIQLQSPGYSWYAPLSSSGVGQWMNTTADPAGAYGLSCAIYSGYIYCVGGFPNADPQTPTDSVYFAPVSSSGVGPWTNTTAYPVNVAYESCVADSGFIYCVGGEQYFAGGVADLVYYAPVSSSGVGAWTAAATYPFTDATAPSCVTSSGYIYCVGGGLSITTPLAAIPKTSGVYYASLTQLRAPVTPASQGTPITVWLAIATVIIVALALVAFGLRKRGAGKKANPTSKALTGPTIHV